MAEPQVTEWNLTMIEVLHLAVIGLLKAQGSSSQQMGFFNTIIKIYPTSFRHGNIAANIIKTRPLYCSIE